MIEARRGTMKKKIVIGLVLAFILLLGMHVSYASGELAMNQLNFDVVLNTDGSMKVTETWKIRIEETNTLFKTFKIDDNKYKGITNVKVAEISNGQKKDFKQIQEEQYHVDKDCFYALQNQKGKFEIAWGAHAKNTTKTYQISYRVEDAITRYQDANELYWQFIGNDSEIPVKKVIGSIELPYGLNSKDEMKVWAHGPLNGNITIESANKVNFEVTNLKPKTYVEIRVVTEKDIFPWSNKIVNQNKMQSILDEEQKWADTANRKRKMQETSGKVVYYGIFIIGNGLGILFLIKSFMKYRRILSENPKLQPEMSLQYYREIPDETASPAMVGWLYYFRNGSFTPYIGRIFSASLLDICQKGSISFEIVDEKKKEIKIEIKETNLEKLTEEEKELYDFLKKADKENDGFITMKQLQKYMETHAKQANKLFREMEETAKRAEIEKGNYDEELIKEGNKWIVKFTGFLLVGIFGIAFMMIMPYCILPIASFVACIYTGKIAGRFNRLTQKGINEKEQWLGLKIYMEEFSMMKEKEVPELILWEKYLIFATVFGIADKVLEQLKVVYPQMLDDNYLRVNGYTYLYMMSHTNGKNSFIQSMDRGIESTYQNINYSSGSGVGGGFSGGGGRRWRRRPEWAEDKTKLKVKKQR